MSLELHSRTRYVRYPLRRVTMGGEPMTRESRYDHDELGVACHCGRSVQHFPAKAVLDGQCQWYCPHHTCKPAPVQRSTVNHHQENHR